MPPFPPNNVLYIAVRQGCRTEYRYCWLYKQRWQMLNSSESPDELGGYFQECYEFTPVFVAV